VILATVVTVAMFLGVIVYALFGGADFGSGFYDLTAGAGDRGREVRLLIDHNIGPGVGGQSRLAGCRPTVTATSSARGSTRHRWSAAFWPWPPASSWPVCS
jgi:hypothetical protein